MNTIIHEAASVFIYYPSLASLYEYEMKIKPNIKEGKFILFQAIKISNMYYNLRNLIYKVDPKSYGDSIAFQDY